jgi:transcriptional regulator with XRE-family HTH domain
MSKLTKEWCLAMAHCEKGEYINAGSFPDANELEQKNSAFMNLVALMRKKLHLSIEKFAEKADIDIIDALQIEGNPSYSPSIRTVYNISALFKIPNKALMQLSGIAKNRYYDTQYDTLPFAACTSGNTDKLSREELVALEQFVAIIAKKTM